MRNQHGDGVAYVCTLVRTLEPSPRVFHCSHAVSMQLDRVELIDHPHGDHDRCDFATSLALAAESRPP